MRFKQIHFLILLLWAFLVVLGLTSRTYFPIDETRYATVAWNMWLNNDYLVPYLNGIAYSHKPPLLFWLMNLGWKIFGVNDWWPRLIPSLFALASLYVTRKISALLWPNNESIKDIASLVLMSCGLWVVYSTALMFDMMIAFFTTLGIWGLLLALNEPSKKGWILLALAFGGGLLAKGPTILLQLLPVALLAPWWARRKLPFKAWYLPIVYSVLAGIIIVLCWAIPAGIHGGSQYQHDIFWGQTANRMVNSFAHGRPAWWYLAILPLLLFPWLFLGTFWKGLTNSKALLNEIGLRFCMAWLVPVFIGFSLISGKQVHYVLPIFPAFALIIARYISITKNIGKLDLLPISIAFVAVGMIWLFIPYYASSHTISVVGWKHLPLWPGLFAIGLGMFLYFSLKNFSAVSVTSISSIALISVSMFVLIHTAGEAYDVRPISKEIKNLELQQVPVAYLGRYTGSYNFLGRLHHSPKNVTLATIGSWFDAHPNGRVVVFFDNIEQVDKSQTEFAQAYKGMVIAVLNQHQFSLQKNPDVQ